MSTNFRNIFGTIIHDVPEGTSPIEFRNVYGTIVHTEPSLSGSVSDITGTVSVSASFDASALPYPTSSYNFQWTWQSLPSGSSLTNQSYPMPDNKANTYFNMSDNKGLWHFEGGATDSSGDGRNGTVNNATLVAGKVGTQAYQFVDADDSYVNFGAGSDFLSTSSPFSLSLWMKGDSGWSPALYDGIVGFTNGFTWSQGVGIFWQNATTIRAFVDRYNGSTVDAAVDPSVWNHLVLTYDQTDIKIYVNGSLIATNGVGATLTGLGNDLQVGRLGTHGRLEAALDEFAIWERTLSDLEINKLYFLQSGSLATDLVDNIGLGDTFTFVPDVSGTFTTTLSITQGGTSISGDINALISTASSPSVSTSSVDAINLFSTVVHNSSPATATAINLYASVVHNATPSTATAINLFSSVVHDTTQISGTLADITGTVGVSASFDGTVLGYSTSSVNLQWTWQSVASGSSLTNQSYPLPDNKVNTYFDMTDNQGLWHFEGNADDTSGNGNNGTAYGATLVTGRVGNEAYSFDGSNDYIEVPHDPSLTVGSEVSISLWVYLNSIGAYEGMVCKGINQGQYWIGLDSGAGGEFSFGTYHWDNKVTSNTVLSTGRWHHIAAVYNSGDVSLYLDGQLDKQQSVGWSLTANTEALTFGVDKPGSDEYLDGVLDEIAIWSRGLSSLEVSNLYFLQSGSLATDLVGNIGLGETFTFVPDISGTFTTNLTVTDGASSLSGNANAFISSTPTPPVPTPVITGSNPTTELITANQIGYSINTYKNNLLGVQRARTVTQVPFRLGGKGVQSLRRRTNTEFTGSS